MAKLNIDLSYPINSEYDFATEIERINLDEERKESILEGKAFVVSKPQSSLKKEFKDPDGIFSSRFGRTLQDANPLSDKYKCECGHVTSRVHNGLVCPICNEKVKFVDDDFGYRGWMVLKDPYYIIHPNLYKALQFFLHSDKLDNLDYILKPIDDKDINGHTIKNKDKITPYHGIGLLSFKEKFDEIMEYYLKKNPNKKSYYDDLMAQKDKIFIQSISVFTLHLRQYKLDGIKLMYEETNSIYIMMTKLVSEINNDELKIFRKRKAKNQLLYDLNNKYLDLYDELVNILTGKKGQLRSVFGGRYNFTSRNVIVPNSKLRIDEVIMPYSAMVELLQQSIVNILQKSYNISYADAYAIWSKAQITKDPIVEKIIRGLIKDSNRGIPVLINRNQR